MRTRACKMTEEVDYEPVDLNLKEFMEEVLTAPLSPVATTAPPTRTPSLKRGRDGKETLAPPPAKQLALGEVVPISPEPVAVLPASVDAVLRDVNTSLSKVLEAAVLRLLPLHNESLTLVEETLRTHTPLLMTVNAGRELYKNWNTVELMEKAAPNRLLPLAISGIKPEHLSTAFHTLVYNGPQPTLKCAQNPLTDPSALVVLKLVYPHNIIELVYSSAMLTPEHLRLLQTMTTINVTDDDVARFECAFMLDTDTPERLVLSCPTRLVGHVKDPNSLFVVPPSRVFCVPRM